MEHFGPKPSRPLDISATNHLGPSHFGPGHFGPVISAPPTLRPLVISAPKTFRPQLYFRLFVCIFLYYIIRDTSSIRIIVYYMFCYNHLMNTVDLRTKCSYYKTPANSVPFYPPTERFGGYSDEPGVRPSSVRPSLNIFVSAQ